MYVFGLRKLENLELRRGLCSLFDISEQMRVKVLTSTLLQTYNQTLLLIYNRSHSSTAAWVKLLFSSLIHHFLELDGYFIKDFGENTELVRQKLLHNTICSFKYYFHCQISLFWCCLLVVCSETGSRRSLTKAFLVLRNHSMVTEICPKEYDAEAWMSSLSVWFVATP